MCMSMSMGMGMSNGCMWLCTGSLLWIEQRASLSVALRFKYANFVAITYTFYALIRLATFQKKKRKTFNSNKCVEQFQEQYYSVEATGLIHTDNYLHTQTDLHPHTFPTYLYIDIWIWHLWCSSSSFAHPNHWNQRRAQCILFIDSTAAAAADGGSAWCCISFIFIYFICIHRSWPFSTCKLLASTHFHIIFVLAPCCSFYYNVYLFGIKW